MWSLNTSPCSLNASLWTLNVATCPCVATIRFAHTSRCRCVWIPDSIPENAYARAASGQKSHGSRTPLSKFKNTLCFLPRIKRVQKSTPQCGGRSRSHLCCCTPAYRRASRVERKAGCLGGRREGRGSRWVPESRVPSCLQCGGPEEPEGFYSQKKRERE